MISYGVGGAEALNCLYSKFEQESSYDVRNIAISKYARLKLTDSIYIDMNKIVNYIRTEKPDLVINETSNGTDIQNEISYCCKKYGIKNISLLDTQGEYQRRFEDRPDLIIVPSESIKQEMLQVGFEEDILAIGGNPAFDRLENYEYFKSINLKNPRILFVSQPFVEYGMKLSQLEIFVEFYNEISKYIETPKIKIKLHPNENIRTWSRLLLDLRDDVQILKHDDKKDFLSECLDFDLVIGYDSTIMVQTNLMNIPTIFYENEFKISIEEFFGNGEIFTKGKYTDFEKNATEKCYEIIINYIKKMKKK